MENWLLDLWHDPTIRAGIVTAVLTVILDVGRRLAIPKGRVAWGVSNSEIFLIPNQPTTISVRIQELFVQNVGRDIANNVEVTLNYAPQNWHIFPPIAEGVQTTNDRFLRIKAKTLNKREFFRVSLFDAIDDLPLVVSVRWDGGVAK